MTQAFGSEGITVKRVREQGLNLVANNPENQSRHLFREGGNIQALAARALGAPTRVIGLTWIDEHQSIMVRSDAGVLEPRDLKGMRFALPAYARSRGESIARGMALHGIKSALALGGLTLDDVKLIEIPAPPVERASPAGMRRLWLGLEWLAAGKVDAVYVKGAAAAESAARLHLEVGLDLDAFPSRLARVNNGTPRPIVVHQHMIDHHPDLVECFLEQSLRAADWAANNPLELKPIIAQETLADVDAVERTYKNNFHRSLHPDLAEERIEMLRIQAQFLWLHGFLESPVDVEKWICSAPLRTVLARHKARSRVLDR
ncbi:MAG: ABC transporter substrate-binding protein [Sphingobium sp.]|uniref:ABC transporter substrate-binding protein n=1 Tax=Sphingobium sp. TaxID=1912891 RepID=UPI0029B6BA3A|nr:ABC transporter substrate-binding protein [Sphingobium sp.]MDX3909836.1 ABC transporter substrate-binding protein [Sphingobium sp.]